MFNKKVIKNKKSKSLGIILFRGISIIIIIACLAVLYNWNENNKKNISIINELGEYAQITGIEQEALQESENSNDSKMENNSQKLIVNFEELKTKNSDIVAWIKVNNTNINFPIVKTSDNNYYLKHNFNKESNGAGWIFADYRCSFDDLGKNTIIYGHNRRNGTMFSNLSYMLNKDWNFENENSYFSFATKSKSYKAEIFSVYMINASKLTIPNSFSDNFEFENYINSIKSLSIYNFNVNVSESDNIVTLCTCDNTSRNRIVVHAKLIEQ